MTDTLTPAERSSLMAKVRSKDNRSTEFRVIAKLEDGASRSGSTIPVTLSADPSLIFLKIALLWVWTVVSGMRVPVVGESRKHESSLGEPRSRLTGVGTFQFRENSEEEATMS